MLPVNVTIDHGGQQQRCNVAWNLLREAAFATAKIRSRQASAAPIHGGRLLGRGRATIPAMSSSENGWRNASGFNPATAVTVAGQAVAREWNAIDRRRRRRSDRRATCVSHRKFFGKPGAVRRVYVSAITKPEDAFARRDPENAVGSDVRPLVLFAVSAVDRSQLAEVIPHSHAEQIRQVAQNEGAVLTRIEGLIFLITLAALLASALAVSAAMATAIFERRAEVGLMKALGAGKIAVASVFFAEVSVAGIAWRRRPGLRLDRCSLIKSAAPSSVPIYQFRQSCCR